jgi:F1F0 ATPase subunit 2
MNEFLTLMLPLLVGAGLGFFFFGGLWWTIQNIVHSKQPALLFLGSMVTRTCVTLLGFYLIAESQWQRLLVCLVGFLLARFTVTWLVKETSPSHQVSHAP